MAGGIETGVIIATAGVNSGSIDLGTTVGNSKRLAKSYRIASIDSGIVSLAKNCSEERSHCAFSTAHGITGSGNGISVEVDVIIAEDWIIGGRNAGNIWLDDVLVFDIDIAVI